MRALGEGKFKHRLIEQARIEPGMRVLDIGCGTGTLMFMLKSSCPESQVFGLDADSHVLSVANAKIRQLGLEVHLAPGSATALL